MKSRNILYTLVLSLFVFSACDKSNPGPVMNSDPGSPQFTAPESGQSYTLSEDQAADTLLTLEWTNPDYGFAAAPSYTIQMSTSEDFADPIQLANVTGTSYSISVGDMNSKLLGAGLPAEQETMLQFRVMASLSDSLQKQVSDALPLSFTAYSVCKFCPEIYVPGSYQAASGYGSDWTPADAPALHTATGQDVYDGYVYMANGSNQFKFTTERNWSLNYGDDNADGTLDSGGANIEAAEAGYYQLHVDLNSLTYSMKKTTWGLIGDATATGWDSDMNLTYDPQEKVWKITTDLTANSIKFRANDAWDINYGDSGADGTLELNGDNISVSSAGNYTVTLDLNSWPYTYTLTKN